MGEEKKVTVQISEELYNLYLEDRREYLDGTGEFEDDEEIEKKLKEEDNHFEDFVWMQIHRVEHYQEEIEEIQSRESNPSYLKLRAEIEESYKEQELEDRLRDEFERMQD